MSYVFFGEVFFIEFFVCLVDEIERKDVTGQCESVMKILENAAATDSKLTAVKILDAWQGKGAGVNRVKVRPLDIQPTLMCRLNQIKYCNKMSSCYTYSQFT